MALPKEHRLPLGEKKVFGKTHDGSFFKLVFIKNDNEKRFAFVVSNKVSKKAAVRNKIKRRLTEGIKELLADLQNGDYIFYVKKEIVDKSSREIKEELKKFYAKSFITNPQRV